MTIKSPTARSIAAEVVAVLVDVPRATIHKLAEDCDCTYAAVYRAMPLLKRLQLVEDAGDHNMITPGSQPKTYRLHRRIRAK
jgi:hypothetical protein